MNSINNIISPRDRKHVIANHILFFWLFLIVEVMFFSGLISSFFVTRLKHIQWPPESQFRLPVFLTLINTAVLFLSGLTMIKAYKTKMYDFSVSFKWILITCILGLIFLSIQGYEWISLIKEGLTLRSLGIYASFFYILIGTHAFHVFMGLLFLWIFALFTFIKLNYLKTNISIANMEDFNKILDEKKISLHQFFDLVSLYWYFVVILWPIIYLIVYWM